MQSSPLVDSDRRGERPTRRTADAPDKGAAAGRQLPNRGAGQAGRLSPQSADTQRPETTTLVPPRDLARWMPSHGGEVAPEIVVGTAPMPKLGPGPQRTRGPSDPPAHAQERAMATPTATRTMCQSNRRSAGLRSWTHAAGAACAVVGLLLGLVGPLPVERQLGLVNGFPVNIHRQVIPAAAWSGATPDGLSWSGLSSGRAELERADPGRAELVGGAVGRRLSGGSRRRTAGR